MDDLFLKVDLPDYANAFDHSQSFLMMGSCFAEEMGNRLQELRFKTCLNPNGILYNPLNIADVLSHALDGTLYSKSDLLSREDVFLSWQHHGLHYGMDPDAFLSKLNQQAANLNTFLLQADVLILTFGTSYHWVLKEGANRVVNCHKQPSDLFEKTLCSTKQLAGVYTALINRLKAINPGLKVLLTVSPVRYKRDGIIENNRSKARLLLLCEYLEAQYAHVAYFPAYELLIDGLRDYRFFAQDRVHPSKEAVDLIWKQFVQSCFSDEAKKLIKDLDAYNRSRRHRSLYPDSVAAKKFEASLEKKGRQLDELLKKYL